MGKDAEALEGEAAALRELIREASSRPPLRPGEQERLLREVAEGDQASQERLIAAYLPAVVRLAATRTDKGLSMPDLVQEGSIGLIEAMRTFAASGEPDFATFAEAGIAAQLSSAIETEAGSVRDERLLVTAAEDYDRTEIVLIRELRREPSEKELAEKLEWTVERTRYVAGVVAEARKRHDEELLAFIDPDEIDPDAEPDFSNIDPIDPLES